MSISTQNPVARLVIRDFLVISAAIGFIFAIFVGLARPFESLSYLIAAAVGASSVILFGWSCYLGHNKTITESHNC